MVMKYQPSLFKITVLDVKHFSRTIFTIDLSGKQ